MGKKMKRAAARTATHGHVTATERNDSASFTGETLTLSEVAAMLPATADHDSDSNLQRVRHWVRENALRPLKSEHGRGKHREYTEDVKYWANVLHVMTSAGLPISYSRFIPDALRIVYAKAEQWRVARSKGEAVMLPPIVIGMTSAGRAQVSEGKLRDERGFKTADVVLKIKIDLAKIFAEVDRHGRS